ncbi:DUF4277 domain-containing protein, partial [Streptomyces broussonetiae]|uniref:DUF4277 domain-containing protein n=1 Tax=Streptomyces broussonetiae TaxID=2686304 RepID=UPI0035D764C9
RGQFLRRLDVAGIIDGLCPMRNEVTHITHGQVIEALIANRLSSPMPMFKVNKWAEQWAVDEVFGITPDFLNDDRIGRALHAIAPHLAQINGSVGAKAKAEFGIDTTRWHWDMTSISLHGAYDSMAAVVGHSQAPLGVDVREVPACRRVRPPGVGQTPGGWESAERHCVQCRPVHTPPTSRP